MITETSLDLIDYTEQLLVAYSRLPEQLDTAREKKQEGGNKNVSERSDCHSKNVAS